MRAEHLRAPAKRSRNFEPLRTRIPGAHFNFFRRDACRANRLQCKSGWIPLLSDEGPVKITPSLMAGRERRIRQQCGVRFHAIQMQRDIAWATQWVWRAAALGFLLSSSLIRCAAAPHSTAGQTAAP